MYIAQRSVFSYMLHMTLCSSCHNEFAGKDGHRERQYSSSSLREKILRETMDSTLCKLSMNVRIAKAACNKHSWVWFTISGQVQRSHMR